MKRHIRDKLRDPDADPEHWRGLLREANLPERYWGASAEAITAPTVRAWTESVANGASQWLSAGDGFYLMGALNSGKSSVAAILLKCAVMRFQCALWLPVRDIPGVRFRDTPRMEELDSRLRTCDFLVIDDLGSERFKRTGPAASALEETARIIYDRGRSLVVTSNYSWRQLNEEYGTMNEPLVSVLRRMVKPVEILNDQWPMEPM